MTTVGVSSPGEEGCKNQYKWSAVGYAVGWPKVPEVKGVFQGKDKGVLFCQSRVTFKRLQSLKTTAGLGERKEEGRTTD